MNHVGSDSNWIGMLGAVSLAVVLILASCSACGYSATLDERGVRIAQPEVDARATGVAQAAYLAQQATRQSLDTQATREATVSQATATAAATYLRATGTAVAQAAQATATAAAQQAEATATAVPHQAGMDHARANTLVVAWWLAVIIGVGGGLLVAVRLGWFAGSVVAREARTLRRDTLGNAPLVLERGQLQNPELMLSPVQTTTRHDDWVWQLYRLYHLCTRGEILSQPGWTVDKHDGGALPAQYGQLAEGNAQARIMAAAMRPDLPDGRKPERLRLVQKRVSPAQAARHVEVIYEGEQWDRAMASLARQLDDPVPQLETGQVVDQPAAMHTTPTGASPLVPPTDEEIAARIARVS